MSSGHKGSYPVYPITRVNNEKKHLYKHCQLKDNVYFEKVFIGPIKLFSIYLFTPP